MLKLMREQFKNLKIVLWFVVFVFVLLIFVDWGTGRAGGPRGWEGIAAKVSGVTISEAQFLNEMRSNEERFRRMYGQQYEALRGQLDLASMTIQNLIDRQLMLAEADRMGLDVSDRELLDRITSYPVFKGQDGAFVGEELYTRILRTNNSTPEQFEAALRQDMRIEKLQQALSAGILVTDSDVEREYRKRNETASFEVVFLPIEKTVARAVVGDVEARAYFDAHQDRFTHPEQRQIRYLLVDDARLRRSIAVDEARIAEYYTGHSSEFTSGEEVRARHILIRPAAQEGGEPSDEAWRQALDRVREVSARSVAPGADFPALAREFTDDTGSRETGGDLGWFGRGRMVKEFEDAVFALQPGEVSAPVKSQYGYHLIRLEERRAAGQRPLAEVRESIRARLAEGLADAEGSRRANALKEKIDAAKLTTDEEWRALADDVVSSNVTPFFAKDEPIPGLGRDPELLNEAGGAKEGFVGGPRRTQRGWIVYRIAKVREAGTTPFEETKAEALEGARRAKAVELAQQELSGRRSQLGPVPAATLAEQVGGTAQTVSDHRRGSAVAGVGSAPALEDAVFAAPVGTTTAAVAVGDRGAALARVTAKATVDPAALARDRETLRASMVQDEVQQMISAMIAEARRENPAEINSELIDRFKPQQG